MTAIRSVLLHLDDLPLSTVRLDFARALARRHEATLCAMFVGAPPQWPLQMAFTESPAALMRHVDWAAADRTKSLFDAASAAGGVTMRWLDNDSADVVAVFCRQALYADLLVLGQNDPGAASAVAAGFVASVLIATDKPALILPFEGEFQPACNDVLIGWNATPQSARAVTAAMPWLRRARRVHVLARGERRSRAASRRRARHLSVPAVSWRRGDAASPSCVAHGGRRFLVVSGGRGRCRPAGDGLLRPQPGA